MLKRLLPVFACGIVIGVALSMMLVFTAKVVDDDRTTVERASRSESLDDLRKCNEAVDQYTADRKAPPKSINELVEAGYLKNADYPTECIP